MLVDSNQTVHRGFVRSSLLENHPAFQTEEVSLEHIDRRLLRGPWKEGQNGGHVIL
jgi:hypothetical protein